MMVIGYFMKPTANSSVNYFADILKKVALDQRITLDVTDDLIKK